MLAVTCALLLFSCQKETSQVEQPATEITEEEARVMADESTQAEASFDDVEDLSMMAAEEEAIASEDGRGTIIFPFVELRLRLGPCANITVSPNDSTYPKTITIDFGNGCICADGKFRAGKVVIHLTAPIRRPGAVMTVTFVRYHLNRAHIEGTKIVSNLSAGGNIKFTVQVVGGKVTFPSGRGYKVNSLKYVRQVEGGNTRTIRDDVYKIEGRSKTEFNNGLTVVLDTETPLVKKVICPWISDGKLKIKINRHVLFLDYGAPNNGACDNKALLSWNGGQVLIVLP
jgi:hypothetical protein